MKTRKSTSKLSFIAQGSIESYTFIVCYLIGLLRMVLFLNQISEEGIAHYAYAFEFYNIIYIISVLGISKALTQMVGIRQSKKQHKNSVRYFKYTLLRVGVLSILLFVFMFIGGEWIADTVLGDTNCSLAIRCFGCAMIPASFMTVLGHYFKGLGLKVPYLFSQVIESVVNLVITLIVGSVLFQYGQKVAGLLLDASKKNAYGAAAGAIGTFFGALFGTLFLVLIMFLLRNNFKESKELDNMKNSDSYFAISNNLEFSAIGFMLPILFANLAVFVNQLLYFRFAKGSKTSLAISYGAYYGKVRIIIYFFVIFGLFMQNVLSGQLRKILSKDDYNFARQRIGQSIKEILCFMLPIAVYLGVVCGPLFGLLFKGDSKAAVGYMQIACCYLIISSICFIGNAVLKAMDMSFFITLFQGIACFIEIITFGLFFANDKSPVNGLIISLIIGAFIQTILVFVIVVRKIRYKQEILYSICYPLVSALMIGLLDFLVCKFLGPVLGNFVTVLITFIISVICYYGFILFMGVLKEHELNELPLGHFICSCAKLVNIMKK